MKIDDIALATVDFPPIVRAMNSAEQALEEARRAGIDLDLLDTKLALTYEQRVLRHESALELVFALREAGIAHEKSAADTPKTH